MTWDNIVSIIQEELWFHMRANSIVTTRGWWEGGEVVLQFPKYLPHSCVGHLNLKRIFQTKNISEHLKHGHLERAAAGLGGGFWFFWFVFM